MSMLLVLKNKNKTKTNNDRKKVPFVKTNMIYIYFVKIQKDRADNE